MAPNARTGTAFHCDHQESPSHRRGAGHEDQRGRAAEPPNPRPEEPQVGPGEEDGHPGDAGSAVIMGSAVRPTTLPVPSSTRRSMSDPASMADPRAAPEGLFDALIDILEDITRRRGLEAEPLRLPVATRSRAKRNTRIHLWSLWRRATSEVGFAERPAGSGRPAARGPVEWQFGPNRTPSPSCVPSRCGSPIRRDGRGHRAASP